MKKSKKILFVLLSLFFHSLLYSASPDTTSIIDNIYNYDFLKASERLLNLNEKDSLVIKTLNLEIRWWMAIEKGDKDHFTEFLNTLDEFEKAGNTEISEVSEIISSTYRMRYYACSNKSFMIPFLFLKIKKQVAKVDIEKLENLSRDGFELFIMYKSFLTLVQNSFFIDKFSSDTYRKQELIGNIENVIGNGSSPNRTIGRYFLMKYYLDIEKDKPKAFGYLSELHKQYPKNIIFTQLLTN
jgi:hypothetical protein